VSKPKDDISQIRKYLEGKLDNHAMHELEKRALDDPFLADALEGYANTGDQQENLAELSDRLKERTETKVKRLIPWRAIAVAASMFIALGIGVWIFTKNDQPVKQQTAAATTVKPNSQSQALSAPITAQAVPGNTVANDSIRAGSITSPQLAENVQQEKSVGRYNNASAQKAVSEDNEVNVPQPTQTAPAIASQQAMAKADIAPDRPKWKDTLKPDEIAVQSIASAKKRDFKSPPETLLQSKVEGVTVNPATQSKNITGLVLANGLPVTGATVKVAGANFGAVTDVNGRFDLHNVPDNATVSVGYLGYQSKKVKVSGKDSLNISLDQSQSSLAEVVVNKSTEGKKINYEDAHPSTGWQSFNDYLKTNAVSPDGKTGRVHLTFIVDGKGGLSNFTITKSLSSAADQKAIDLVKNGPDWISNGDKAPHEVKVTVKFH
jgi:TonB family protein